MQWDMATDKKKKIYLICGLIIAILVVALGVALMLSCWDIYTSGSSPYSPASIGQRFEKIAFLVYLTLAAVLGGVILGFVLPVEKERPRAIRDGKVTLEKMKAKAGNITGVYATGAQQEQKKRMQLRAVTASIFTAMMVYPVIYFLNIDHFTVISQNSDIAKAMTLVLIPGIIGLGLCYVCALFANKSIHRETELYKKYIADNKGQLTPVPQTEKSGNSKRLRLIRGVVLAVAVVFIIAGIINGGADDVLLKAIVICTECIGLG